MTATAITTHRAPRFRWRRVALHGTLIMLCLWMLAPLVWLVMFSMRSRVDSAQRYIWPNEWVDPLWARYQWLWQELTLQNEFWNSYLNSVMVTVMTVIAATSIAVLAGYALAMLDTPWKPVILTFLVASMFFPTQVTAMLGIWSIHNDLGLIGETWSLALPYTAMTLALSIFVMRGSFQMVSRELTDSAKIDGASSLRTLLQIVLPLVWGGVMVVAVLNFSAAWGEYVLASILVNNREEWTLGVLMGRGGGGPRSAGIYVMAILPALVIFAVGQRWFLRSIGDTVAKT